MNESFDKWNIEKQCINNKENYMPFYKEREIRWCQLGANIGFEQDGKGEEFARPVLIVKGFNRRMCLIVPLTTKMKNNVYYLDLGIIENKCSAAIISQLRIIDTRRLGKIVSRLDKISFDYLKEKIRSMI